MKTSASRMALQALVGLLLVGCRHQAPLPPASGFHAGPSAWQFTGLIYCWHVSNADRSVAGYCFHDGSTGYIPACSGAPCGSVEEVAASLDRLGARQIVLVPAYPASPERGWTTRTLTAEEQAMLVLAADVVAVRDRP